MPSAGPLTSAFVPSSGSAERRRVRRGDAARGAVCSGGRGGAATGGDWLIVELGDAQVAGLPDHADVDGFYKSLREHWPTEA
jgi:hypothetical protein